MKRLDQALLIVFCLAGFYFAFIFGEMIGGEKARNEIVSVSPGEAQRIDKSISMTDVLVNGLFEQMTEKENNCKNDIQYWRGLYLMEKGKCDLNTPNK